MRDRESLIKSIKEKVRQIDNQIYSLQERRIELALEMGQIQGIWSSLYSTSPERPPDGEGVYNIVFVKRRGGQ